jgi:hypothetical protein
MNNKDSSSLDIPKQSFKKFLPQLKRITIEIIVIVFSVYVSIWLTNRSQYNMEQEEARAFLSDLKNDLEVDIHNMKDEKAKIEESKNGISSLLKLSKKQMEEVGFIDMKIQFNTRRNIEANYEGFKSSGKIGNIEKRKLKNDILSYYQEHMSVTTEMEKDINSTKKDIIELFGKNNFNANSLSDPYLRTKMNLYIGIVNSLAKAYDDDIKLAKTIINEMKGY